MSSITEQDRLKILRQARSFFRDVIVRNHIQNIRKLGSLACFSYNPFLLQYLGELLGGRTDARNLAKALIYPRVLGTSISTSFGTGIQHFCSQVLPGFGSAISGIDLEFTDCLDGRRKYCQVKSGPQTINRDDVDTIEQHFERIRNLARTNHLDLRFSDLVVGVLYGKREELSGNYRALIRECPVYVGEEFWYHLTGKSTFYNDLIDAFGEVAGETRVGEVLEAAIGALASQIEARPLQGS